MKTASQHARAQCKHTVLAAGRRAALHQRGQKHCGCSQWRQAPALQRGGPAPRASSAPSTVRSAKCEQQMPLIGRQDVCGVAAVLLSLFHPSICQARLGSRPNRACPVTARRSAQNPGSVIVVQTASQYRAGHELNRPVTARQQDGHAPLWRHRRLQRPLRARHRRRGDR